MQNAKYDHRIDVWVDRIRHDVGSAGDDQLTGSINPSGPAEFRLVGTL